MVWKVSEHVKGLLLWFNHSSVLSLLQGWASVFSCLLICWSDLKLYYLVTLQFVSGLIQIVTMDKLCIIHKKIQVRFKTKAFNNFLWKIVCFYCSTSKPILKNSMLYYASLCKYNKLMATWQFFQFLINWRMKFGWGFLF
jgi:hypothetical protein